MIVSIDIEKLSRAIIADLTEQARSKCLLEENRARSRAKRAEVVARIRKQLSAGRADQTGK